MTKKNPQQFVFLYLGCVLNFRGDTQNSFKVLTSQHFTEKNDCFNIHHLMTTVHRLRFFLTRSKKLVQAC